MRAAEWLRSRRLEIAALEVRETAKPWREADADVCEAIDFLEYYAREAIELAERPGELIQLPGERNELRWAPRGVVAVISPWNFPVAIPLGMVSAGLATGNAVVLKPAEQAPACAYMLVRALRESGLPRFRLALLPGEGPVGAALVGDPRVHTIAFTGSGPVGLEILRAGRRDRARAAAPEARRGRDGRQELRDRGLRRRPRRRRPRAGEVGLQLRRPEVLGGGARARARGDPRRAGRAPGGRDRGAARRPGVGPGDRRAAGDRARGAGARRPLRRERRGVAGRSPRAPRRCPTTATSPHRRWPPTCRRIRPCWQRRSSDRCWRSNA